MEVGHRHLGRRDEVVALARLEQVRLELGQAGRCRRGSRRWRETEAAPRGSRAPRRARRERNWMSARESRAAAPCSTVNRAPAILAPRSKSRMPSAGPEVPVRLRREVEPAELAPGPLDAIGGLVRTARDRGVRDVGDELLDRREHPVGLLGALLELADLFLERLHLRERLGRRLGAHGRELVAPAALLLELRHRVAALLRRAPHTSRGPCLRIAPAAPQTSRSAFSRRNSRGSMKTRFHIAHADRVNRLSGPSRTLPDVDCVVVNRDGGDALFRALASLERQTGVAPLGRRRRQRARGRTSGAPPVAPRRRRPGSSPSRATSASPARPTRASRGPGRPSSCSSTTTRCSSPTTRRVWRRAWRSDERLAAAQGLVLLGRRPSHRQRGARVERARRGRARCSPGRTRRRRRASPSRSRACPRRRRSTGARRSKPSRSQGDGVRRLVLRVLRGRGPLAAPRPGGLAVRLRPARRRPARGLADRPAHALSETRSGRRATAGARSSATSRRRCSGAQPRAAAGRGPRACAAGRVARGRAAAPRLAAAAVHGAAVARAESRRLLDAFRDRSQRASS